VSQTDEQVLEELEEEPPYSLLDKLRLAVLVGGVLLAAGVAGAGLMGHLVVALGHLVPWQLLAAVLLVVAALLGGGDVWRRATVAMLGVLVGVLGVFWDGAYDVHDVSLDPGGPEGCRVVVRPSGFMSGVGGTVYVRHGLWGSGDLVATYSGDAGVEAARERLYTLSWSGRTAHLSLGTMMGAGHRSATFHCG